MFDHHHSDSPEGATPKGISVFVPLFLSKILVDIDILSNSLHVMLLDHSLLTLHPLLLDFIFLGRFQIPTRFFNDSFGLLLLHFLGGLLDLLCSFFLDLIDLFLLYAHPLKYLLSISKFTPEHLPSSCNLSYLLLLLLGISPLHVSQLLLFLLQSSLQKLNFLFNCPKLSLQFLLIFLYLLQTQLDIPQIIHQPFELIFQSDVLGPHKIRLIGLLTHDLLSFHDRISPLNSRLPPDCPLVHRYVFSSRTFLLGGSIVQDSIHAGKAGSSRILSEESFYKFIGGKIHIVTVGKDIRFCTIQQQFVLQPLSAKQKYSYICHRKQYRNDVHDSIASSCVKMNDKVPKKIAKSKENKGEFKGTYHKFCKLKTKISGARKSSEDVIFVDPILWEEEDNEDEGGKRCDITIEGDDESLDYVVGIGILKIVFRVL